MGAGQQGYLKWGRYRGTNVHKLASQHLDVVAHRGQFHTGKEISINHGKSEYGESVTQYDQY